MPSKQSFLVKLVLLPLLLALLAGCAAVRPKPAGLTDEQVGAVAENLLKALNTGDHAAFSRDFSDQMKAAFPESEFTKLRDLLAGASGQFQALEGDPKLANNGEYAVYSFPARYEQEQVVVTLTFAIGGDQVVGLFFSSPNLKKSVQ